MGDFFCFFNNCCCWGQPPKQVEITALKIKEVSHSLGPLVFAKNSEVINTGLFKLTLIYFFHFWGRAAQQAEEESSGLGGEQVEEDPSSVHPRFQSLSPSIHFIQVMPNPFIVKSCQSCSVPSSLWEGRVV